MKDASRARQWNAFLARFTPEIAALARGSLARMRKRLPGATELVYDNYNALVIGFGPSERASEALFSLAVYPKWVNLFFLRGAGLDDPNSLLKGSGRQVRHVRLTDPKLIDDPGVRGLMARALALAARPIDPAAPRRMVVRSVSARQRPRRPR
jgi:hypothetical protein